MGNLETGELNNWGQARVDRAQKELDDLNAQIAEVGTDLALTACSSVPGVGIACDFASLGRSVAKGDWWGAALDLVGFVPVVGDGIKGAVRGGKALKTAGALNDALKVSQEVVSQARRVVNAGTDALRAAARTSGEIMNIRRAAAKRYWRLQREMKRRAIMKKFKDCNTAACRRQQQKELAELQNNTVGAGRLPSSGGKWKGKPGNGTWIPDEGSDLAKALKKYPGQKGIEFKDGFPDFSPFVRKGSDGKPIEVEISNMRGNNDGVRTDGTIGDFGQARQAMSERQGRKWNASKMEDVWTWHHKEDGTTMQLIDTDVHKNVPHQGGASMMRDRETF